MPGFERAPGDPQPGDADDRQQNDVDFRAPNDLGQRVRADENFDAGGQLGQRGTVGVRIRDDDGVRTEFFRQFDQFNNVVVDGKNARSEAPPRRRDDVERARSDALAPITATLRGVETLSEGAFALKSLIFCQYIDITDNGNVATNETPRGGVKNGVSVLLYGADAFF